MTTFKNNVEPRFSFINTSSGNITLGLEKYAYRKPSAGGMFENLLAFQSAILLATPTVALIDCDTVTHDLSFVNILLSLFATIPKSIFFEIPADPEGQATARQLSNVMFLRSVDLPRRWAADVEP